MKILYFFVLSIFTSASAQQYVNGTLATGTTSKSGMTAPPGGQWAELQHDIADPTITNTSWGAPIENPTNPARYADDFVIPVSETWHLSQLEVFGTIENQQTEIMPFQSLGVEIWNGDPSLPGSQKIYGDIFANYINVAASGLANLYHIQNTLFFPIATRPIWSVKGDIDVILPAGTYWVFFRFMTTFDAAGIRAPFCIDEGKRTLPHYNSKAYRPAINAWNDLRDGSNLTPFQFVMVDLPFRLNYAEVLGTAEANQTAVIAYPNPVEENLFLRGQGLQSARNGKILVTDIRGLSVLERDVTFNNDGASIDLSTLQTGLYIVRVTGEDGSNYVTKIVKQ